MLQVVGMIGTALLALGLYGKFGARGGATLPILNNPEYAYGLIVIGAIILACETMMIIPVLKRLGELSRKANK